MARTRFWAVIVLAILMVQTVSYTLEQGSASSPDNSRKGVSPRSVQDSAQRQSSLSNPSTPNAPPYLTKFGGIGQGSFGGVWGLTVDHQGDIYVGDYVNRRVDKFDYQGNFLMEISTDNYNPGYRAQWTDIGPRSIAVDPNNGTIYVVGNVYGWSAIPPCLNVLKFSANGTLLQCWTASTPTDQCGVNCSSNAVSVAVDQYGFVYVETVNSQTAAGGIVKFTADGVEVPFGNSCNAYNPPCFPSATSSNTAMAVVGSYLYVGRTQPYGSHNVCDPSNGAQDCIFEKATLNGTFVSAFGNNTQYNYVFGIAVDSQGYIYASETFANTIVKVDPNNGNIVAQYGSLGQAHGQFYSPTSIWIDGQGRIYVADFNNDRVQIFDSSMNFVRAFGESSLYPHQMPDNTWALAVYEDRKGETYVADVRPSTFVNSGYEGDPSFRISKFALNGTLLLRMVLSEGEPYYGYGIYANLANPPTVYGGGILSLSLPHPVSIAVNETSGAIYLGILDENYSPMGSGGEPLVAKLDSTGNLLSFVTLENTCYVNGYYFCEWYFPGLALDSRGFVYATDGYLGEVRKFDGNLRSVGNWTVNVPHPSGIAVDSKGFVYVSSDNDSAAVYRHGCGCTSIYNGTGTLVGQFSAGGNYLTIDARDNLYVSSYGSSSLTKFDRSRNKMFSWTFLTSPFGVSLDAMGNIYSARLDGATNNAPSPYPAASIFTYIAPTQALASIFPNRGGDTGLVTVQITTGGGYFFVNGTTARLVKTGSQDIIGDPEVVSADALTIIATYNLTGRAQGAWDVVVTSPDGGSMTLPGAFTIEPGHPGHIEVDLIGPSIIRNNYPGKYNLVITNTGDTDAIYVPVWIVGIPTGSDLTIDLNVLSPVPFAGQQPINWTQVPIYVQQPDGTTSVPLLIPVVPPGGWNAGNIVLDPKLPAHSSTTIGVQANPNYCVPNSPGSPTSSPTTSSWVPAALDCLDQLAELALEKIVETLFSAPPGGSQCIAQAKQLFVNLFHSDLVKTLVGTERDLSMYSLVQLLLDIGKVTLNCIKELTGAQTVCLALGGPACETVKILFAVWGVLKKSNAIVSHCIEFFTIVWQKLLSITQLYSWDPNNKMGPGGSGAAQYVSGQGPLPYTIMFENEANATAPAQEVIIRDQLNSSLIDLSSVRLGPIAFGNTRVLPLVGESNFSTDVDLRPQNNLIVRIDVTFQESTGLLTWDFRSIDPRTGNMTRDPLAGFLPPNVNPPRGEGSVLFTVSARDGLPTGTIVQNHAIITFDNNPAINTPVWSNTIDNTRPSSQVAALASVQSTQLFPVQWSGSDTGSGILDYSVFVSQDGGPFNAWLQDANSTSGNFTGSPGHSYEFYSIARDQTGNVEQAKTVGDSSTIVSTSAVPPPPVHDGAVFSIDTARSFGYTGVPVYIFVTVANLGTVNETFTVVANANSTSIGSLNITVGAGTYGFAVFAWNPSSMTPGNYTLSARVLQTPGETNTANNFSTMNGVFALKMTGDVNGDCKVDIIDLVLVASVFGATFGGSSYRAANDLNSDGRIDIVDLVMVASNFGRTC